MLRNRQRLTFKTVFCLTALKQTAHIEHIQHARFDQPSPQLLTLMDQLGLLCPTSGLTDLAGLGSHVCPPCVWLWLCWPQRCAQETISHYQNSKHPKGPSLRVPGASSEPLWETQWGSPVGQTSPTKNSLQ